MIVRTGGDELGLMLFSRSITHKAHLILTRQEEAPKASLSHRLFDAMNVFRLGWVLPILGQPSALRQLHAGGSLNLEKGKHEFGELLLRQSVGQAFIFAHGILHPWGDHALVLQESNVQNAGPLPAGGSS